VLRLATYLTALAAVAAAVLRAPIWVLALAGLAVCGWIAIGMMFPATGIFARPFLRGRAGSRRIALTFDDGPNPETTPRILDFLGAAGHRATFFVIGARAERERALVTELLARGHALGNHSWAHRRTTPLLSTTRLAADFARAQEWLASVGARGRWFRAPIGIVSPPVAAAAARARLELVAWTRSARDGVARTTAAAALARLIPALQPGAILALHDGAERGDRRPVAPSVIGPLLDALEARGLKSVTLDELFGGRP